MRDTQIILDMDGTITDFFTGAMKLHGIPGDLESLYADHQGKYDLLSLFQKYKPKLTLKQFYHPMEQHFWTYLEPMPDFEKILAILEGKFGRENITLWSYPSKNLGCVAGKREWISLHMSEYYSNIDAQNFGSRKWLAANANTILIDDHEQNIIDFTKAGGHTCLVPRLWNPNFGDRHRVIEYVTWRLNTIKEFA